MAEARKKSGPLFLLPLPFASLSVSVGARHAAPLLANTEVRPYESKTKNGQVCLSARKTSPTYKTTPSGLSASSPLLRGAKKQAPCVVFSSCMFA
jgi:hypothetical protein